MARPEDLTIDFKKLLRMTVRDRVQMAKSREGPSYLAALTPTQYAMLFPEYYRKDLPDIGLTAATSGATPLGTVSGEGPSDGKMPTAVPTAPSRGVPTTGGKEVAPSKSTVAKESWQQRLMREAEERRSGKSTKGQLSGIKISDKVIAKSRERFAKELEDPETRKKLFTLMRAEVGGYSREARTAFLEKVMNRSMIQDVSLRDTIENRVTGTGKVSNKPLRKGYFQPLNPGGTITTGKITGISESQSEEYQDILSEVLGGTNITNGGTHNVSGDWGKRHIKDVGGTNVQTFGKTDRFEGEMIYNKPGEYNKVQSYWNQIKEEIGIEEATKVLPPTTDDTGKVIPGQTPGRMAPTTQQPLTALPEGLDPGIVEHYKTLKEDEQKKFLESITGVQPETINQYYREDPNRSASPQVVREKTDGIISNPEALGQEVVLEEQQNAKRRLPIKANLKDQIEEAVLAVYGPGYKARVYSGGSDPSKPETMASTSGRHDYGNAADVYIEGPDGKLSREEQMPLAQYWMSKGYGSIGLGMAQGGMHIDNDQRKGAWGYGRNSATGKVQGKWDYLSDPEKALIEEARKGRFSSKYSQFEGFADRVRQIEKEQGISRAEARALAREELRKKIESPVEPVPEEATAVTTPQTAPPSTEPPAAGNTGSPTPNAPGYPGALQPRTDSTAEPTKTTTNVTTSSRKEVGGVVVEQDGKPVPGAEDNPEVKLARQIKKDLEGGSKATAEPVAPKQNDLLPDASDPKVQKAMENAKPTGEDYRETVKKMQYGGSVHSAADESILVSNAHTGKPLFTMNEEETLHKDEKDRLIVRPNRRGDSEEIERLAKSRGDYMNNDARDRMAATSTQANQQSMAQPSPVNNPNLQQMYSQMAQESMSTYKTPSAARAFKESRFQGRGDDPFALAPANVKT